MIVFGEKKKTMSLHCQLKLTLKMYHHSMYLVQLNINEKLRFIFEMKYGKHPASTTGNDQLSAYFRHFAGHLTCSYNFRRYKRPWKLKIADIYPCVFETKTRKFGNAKIFHFTVSKLASSEISIF